MLASNLASFSLPRAERERGQSEQTETKLKQAMMGRKQIVSVRVLMAVGTGRDCGPGHANSRGALHLRPVLYIAFICFHGVLFSRPAPCKSLTLFSAWENLLLSQLAATKAGVRRRRPYVVG